MRLPDLICSRSTRWLLWTLLFFIAIGLHGSGNALAQPSRESQPKLPALPDGVRVDRDVVYTKTPHGDQKLDLYRPTKPADASRSLPVIVFIHGGGWKQGSKASALKQAVWIVPHGFAVASIDYRLITETGWPAQINDCYAAVRWVRKHAAEYGLNAKQIATWGGSAGGHLAALVGTRPSPNAERISSRVQAVCDWYGPSDLLTMPPNVVSDNRSLEQTATSNGAIMLGAAVSTIPDLARDASPLHHVSTDDPPFLIMHGSEDPGVPVDQSTRLAHKLQSTGVATRLEIVSGAGHGGKAFRQTPVRNVVLDFFQSQLK